MAVNKSLIDWEISRLFVGNLNQFHPRRNSLDEKMNLIGSNHFESNF